MILTNWGYSIDSNELSDILSVADFNTMTANKYSTDGRVASTLKSVSSAVRNYVGWHLTDSYNCVIEYNLDDLHIVRHGADIDIRLPVGFLTGVTHAYFGATLEEGVWSGTEFRTSFKSNGIVKVYDVPLDFERYDKLVILFTAGVPSAMADNLKAVVAQRTAHTLSAPVGVTSESAGGVSISYSANYVNGAKATSLLTDDKEALLPYRVTEML